ncbi:hypothetical protein [Flavobacterium davisii]|uniref:hypothetical protein n=1 Tax=Flavobacterium davisii TaxID=2906077 RepID=UPI0021647877|nr:hypothetical protein [Flavobacterium davisii]
MEKKKANSFIIPPTYYKNSSFSITEVKPVVHNPISQVANTEDELKKVEITQQQIETKSVTPQNTEPKLSSLSLSSIRIKKN